MKSEGVLKHLLIAFLIALAVYALSFAGIEHRRTRKGPWQVTFTNSPRGEPVLVVNQPWLALTNVQLIFAAELSPATNAAATVRFDQPRPVPFDVPFGKCIFIDTTFLPGTVTFELFGHEIELLPRVMMVDHEEMKWASSEIIRLPRPRSSH
jgi:hypothetical protein